MLGKVKERGVHGGKGNRHDEQPLEAALLEYRLSGAFQVKSSCSSPDTVSAHGWQGVERG